MQKNKTLRNLVALSIIPGLGARRLRHLLGDESKLERVFYLGKRELRSYEGLGEASALSILSFDEWDKVDAILSKTARIGAQIITISDPLYPPLLKQIYDPPILVWVQGNPESLSVPGVAVIGTRNATSYGKKQAARLTTELASRGLCIFSGLAFGIDATAHKAALEAGGTTVAVLGSGIDNLYPRKNAGVARDIVKSGGAVISEFPLGTNPDAGNFPVRNRIVSGLSLGVVVVESGIQGGSMITAELGLDQNREVFAVPHSLDSAAGTGCNYLIKKGAAKLVQTVDDILDELPLSVSEGQDSKASGLPERTDWRALELDKESQKVCALLEEGQAQLDEISERTGISTSQLLVILLQLEMKGIVKQTAGKHFSLT